MLVITMLPPLWDFCNTFLGFYYTLQSKKMQKIGRNRIPANFELLFVFFTFSL